MAKKMNYDSTMRWGIGACGLITIGMLILAGAIVGSYMYTLSVSNDLDDQHDDVKNLRNAVNPVEVPNAYGHHVVEHDDDDGINSDDDDDDGKQDTAVRDATMVGHSVVADLVDKHGNLIRTGHLDVLTDMTVSGRTLNVTGKDSQLVTEHFSVIRRDNVCASQISGIERGDVVGYNGGCLEKGFITNELWDVLSGYSPDSFHKFDLGLQRSGIIFTNALDQLSMIVEFTDESTNQVTHSVAAVLNPTPYAFSRDCGRVATLYPGTTDHFVVAYDIPTASNAGVAATTCRIDSLTPLAVTCTAVPPTFNAGTTTVPVHLEHVSGTEFALVHADGTNGLSVLAISAAGPTLVTTINAPTVIDAVATDIFSACESYKAFVRGSQVVVAYTSSGPSVPVTVAIAALTGVTFTLEGSTVVMPTVAGASLDIEAIGMSQAVLGVVPFTGTYVADISVMTLTPTGVDLASVNSRQLSITGSVFTPGFGGNVIFTALEENVVGIVYHNAGLSFGETAQVIELYFEGASPRLAFGDFQNFSHMQVDDITCSTIAGTSMPSFSCSFRANAGFVSSGERMQSFVARVGPATTISNGRSIELVHNAPHVPVGIAVSSGGPGSSIKFLTKGDLDDSALFNVDHQTDVCLHCDGSLRTSSNPDDIFRCTAYCACYTSDAHAITCNDIYTSRHFTPRY